MRAAGGNRDPDRDLPSDPRGLLRLTAFGRIIDTHQIKTLGRGHRATARAFARLERIGDLARPPSAFADELQTPDNGAHLVMQKRACLRFDVNLLAGATHAHRIQRLYRRTCLASGVAEGGEIVFYV